MNKNAAAASGVAKSTRRLCSRSSPATPAGMVAAMRSQARRWSGVSIRRVRKDTRRPRAILAQVDRKKTIRATAVAT